MLLKIAVRRVTKTGNRYDNPAKNIKKNRNVVAQNFFEQIICSIVISYKNQLSNSGLVV